MNAGHGGSPRPLLGLLIGGGHGRRAGGPKALRAVDGVWAWQHQVAAMREAGCDEVVAVLHPDAFVPPYLPATAPGAIAIAADPDAPMFASVRLGLQRLVDHPRWPAIAGVALLPVDCPMPAAAVLAALARAGAAASVAGHPWACARPVVMTANGPRFGHPLLIAPPAAAELATADPATTRLDHWLAALPAAMRLDVPVVDLGILANHNESMV